MAAILTNTTTRKLLFLELQRGFRVKTTSRLASCHVNPQSPSHLLYMQNEWVCISFNMEVKLDLFSSRKNTNWRCLRIKS